MNMGKLLITAGVILIIIGVLLHFVGKLPGDIHFKVGNVSVYFPIMTSIIVSIVLTLIFYVIGKFR